MILIIQPGVEAYRVSMARRYPYKPLHELKPEDLQPLARLPIKWITTSNRSLDLLCENLIQTLKTTCPIATMGLYKYEPRTLGELMAYVIRERAKKSPTRSRPYAIGTRQGDQVGLEVKHAFKDWPCSFSQH